MHIPPLRRRALATLVALPIVALAGPLASAAHADTTGTVTGTVRSTYGDPIENATVATSAGYTVTDENGHYELDGVPAGTYAITTEATCFQPGSSTVVVDGPEQKDLVVAQQRDSFGHICMEAPFFYTSGGGTPLPTLVGDDVVKKVTLPFAVPFYGQKQTSAYISTNGYLTFTPQAATDATYKNQELLDPTTPRNGIFAFWDDLSIDDQAQVTIAHDGSSPERVIDIEWTDALIRGTTDRITVGLMIDEQGTIGASWSSSTISDVARGGSATIGIRNGGTGSAAQAFTRSFDQPTAAGSTCTFFGVDHAPVAKAGPDKTVASKAGFTLDGSASTDPDGTADVDLVGNLLHFKWKQVGGPAVTLATPGKAKTQVTGVKGPKTLTFQLRVMDQFGFMSTDTVVVHVKA